MPVSSKTTDPSGLTMRDCRASNGIVARGSCPAVVKWREMCMVGSDRTGHVDPKWIRSAWLVAWADTSARLQGEPRIDAAEGISKTANLLQRINLRGPQVIPISDE